MNYQSIQNALNKKLELIKKNDNFNKSKREYEIVVNILKDKVVDYNNPESVLEELRKLEKLSPSTINKYFKNLTVLIGIASGSEYNEEGRVKKMSDLHSKYNEQNKEDRGKIVEKIKKEKDFDKEKIENTDMNYDKFLVNLFTKYCPLRSDLAIDVKLKEIDKEKDNYYENGVIHFNKNNMVKNKIRDIEIKLDEEDTKFVEELKDKQSLLFETNEKDKNSAFCKKLKESSFKITGLDLGVNNFRRLYFSKIVSESGVDNQVMKNMILKLIDVSELSNTGIETIFKYYLSDVE